MSVGDIFTLVVERTFDRRGKSDMPDERIDMEEDRSPSEDRSDETERASGVGD